MLAEHQVKALLNCCELSTGSQLASIRGQLKSEDVLPALWELLVIFEAARHGKVQYEPHDGDGPRPDILWTVFREPRVFVEASWIDNRFRSEELRSDRLKHEIWNFAKQQGIPPASLVIHVEGDENAKGFVPRLPPQHEARRSARSALVIDFLKRTNSAPLVNTKVSLEPMGFSVRIEYRPERRNAKYLSSSGIVFDQPKTVDAHPLYLRLREKGKHASKCRLRAPYIVLIGSDSQSLKSRGGVSIREEDAVSKAFKEHNRLSAVIVVTIEDRREVLELRTKRAARARPYFSKICRYPASLGVRKRLMEFKFTTWELGHQSWKGRYTLRDRRDNISGGWTYRTLGSKISIEMPAAKLLQLLAGERSAQDLLSTAVGGAPNPFHQILGEGRQLERVDFDMEHLEHQAPPRIVLTFGSPEVPVVGRDSK